MKTKIKIGIPRTFYYSRKGIMCKNFFTKLGCNVILSPETNDKIINDGITSSEPTMCLNYKTYIGHIKNLYQKSDYIVIMRHKKSTTTCPNFSMTYDNIKEIIPSNKLIIYNINNNKFNTEIFEYIKMGTYVTPNIYKILCSYLYGKKNQKKYNINKINYQKHLLNKKGPKVLIMAPFYLMEENIYLKKIINFLKTNKIIPILSNYLDKDTALSFKEYFPCKIKWEYFNEMIGAYYYYQNEISGVITLLNKNCEISSLLNSYLLENIIIKPSISIYTEEIMESKNKLISFAYKVKGKNYE